MSKFNRFLNPLFILSLILLTLSSGCIREDVEPTDPVGNFDALWNLIDQRYCYFDQKNIDWDEVYNTYRPLVDNSTSDLQLFAICSQMLDCLKDGHVNLSSLFDTSYYRKWWSDYPQDFNLRTLQQYYLNFNYHQTSGISYTIFDEKIGYMYYPSFSSGIGQTNLDYILAILSDCEVLIIDIRNNGGGLLTNIRTLVSRFITDETPGGYIIHKTGPAHSDFSSPYSFSYSPAPDGRITWIDKPIIILTNRSCYSAANNFVAIMKTLPNVTVAGAKTGGGGGLPFSSSLPNGWTVRMSASPITAPDGSDSEFGIEPSEGCEIHCSDDELANGTDAILDFAIARARQHIEEMNSQN
ncbi:MAG: S41 family peptidase [Bacteroidales bacterium]|nr:S41 family peptidase [Bacteroidales bacterium]